MVIKSENATTETSDASTMESLDVMPPKPKTPISEFFSFCTPKKQPMEDDDDDDDDCEETDEITGRSLTFKMEDVDEGEDTNEVEIQEETGEASLFDKGLLLQVGVVSALLVFDQLV
ncbi:MAG: hypothetical protein SGBAC_005154 [Bacillariaceae sp.]